MGTVGRVRAWFRRWRSPRLIHPENWPEPSGKPRVLIENPDSADLEAHAHFLRKAGYEVATCTGPAAATGGRRGGRSYLEGDLQPERHERTLCPLISEGHCPLVDGADVVVSTTRLTDSREILATITGRGSPAVVIEGTSADLERDSDVIGDSLTLTEPVQPQQLVDAVERVSSPSTGE